MLKLLREILFNSNMQKVCKSKIDKRLQILGSCRDTWSFYYAKNGKEGDSDGRKKAKAYSSKEAGR